MKVEGTIEFSIIEQTANRVVAEMPIRAGIKNPFGSVHAGAILWFADVSASVLLMGSVQPSDGMQGVLLAINLSANFIGNRPNARSRRSPRSSSAAAQSAWSARWCMELARNSSPMSLPITCWPSSAGRLHQTACTDLIARHQSCDRFAGALAFVDAAFEPRSAIRHRYRLA